MADFIKIENLVFEYIKGEAEPAVRAIDGISFNVEKGSFTAVIGHNCSGKSNIAKNINVLLTTVSCKIYFEVMYK